MSAPHRQGGREGLDEGAATTPGASIGERIAPSDVHEVLGRHLLHDSYPMVFDPVRSHGAYLVDARDGTEYLDFYTFFASSPLGLNPAGLADDEAFLHELAVVAANKPASSDFHTTYLAEFVETFWRVLGDPALPHLFFIEGGAAAVDNAVKVAFDWKSRRNEGAGRSAELGTRVMHLRHAFHGRGGYTLSLTNTDPVKVDRFPKFDWPRIPSPAIRFPLSEHLARVEEEEAEALAAAADAFAAHPHDIACFLAEPIQAEGGDRHLRREFLHAMQELCLEHEALFVLDEVQTGVGVTGTPWCYQQLGLEPDVVSFGKKVQLGGVMAGRRVDDEPENVFRVPSRINSTWGGNLTDMVRSTRLLEIIESTGAIDNAGREGAHLLQRLLQLEDRHGGVISNARGRGLLAAFDLPTGEVRDEVLTSLRTDEHVLALACGDVSLRFRPSLAISAEEVDLACEALDRVLQKKGRVTVATRALSSVIGGKPVGEDFEHMRSTNPAHLDDVVADVALASGATFTDACRVAKAAQQSWADVPAPIRGRAIAEIGRLVEANKEALARLVTREVGKPYAEALGEVQEIIDTCDFFLGEGRRLYGETVPSEMHDKALFTYRMPVGTVAVVTAGNFPVAVPSWYLVPALVCGNTAVWKPAEYSAAVAAALYELFVAGGLPPGVLNLVLADGQATFAGIEAGLSEHVIDKVGFTGSTAVGSLIGELTGRHIQSACLELGGKNPMVIMGDADLDLAVDGALFSGFGTAGQRCTSLGTAIVHESIHDEFLSRLVDRLEGAPLGDPSEDVLYGPMLDARFATRFEEYLDDLIRPHHRLLGSAHTGRITPDHPRDGFIGDAAAGVFCHPTIVDGVRLDDEIARTETFGPMIGVASFRHFDEAMAIANCSGYGLSAAIYTHSPEQVFAFRRRISAGMVSVNNSTSGAEAHLPFGGNGKSGNGSRQSGKWVLDQMTRWQSMNWDYSGRLQKAQMDTESITADRTFRLVD